MASTMRTIASAGSTRPALRLTIFRLAVSLLGFTVSPAGAVDAPVILVQAERLIPERLEVHLGEVVTWRAADGRPLRLELDPHPSGHEVVVRAGEVRANFRKPGEHWYTVTIVNGAGKTLRGTVSVREGPDQRRASAHLWRRKLGANLH